MNSLILCCQLAVCPASGVCVELAAVGIGIISGYTADNQLEILKGFVENECILDAGDFNRISIQEITKLIKGYINNINKINMNIANQKKLIDGISPQRFLALFNELVK